VPTIASIIFGVLSSRLSRDEATALYPKSAWASLMGVSNRLNWGERKPILQAKKSSVEINVVAWILVSFCALHR
jgi:hypothetical protein